MNNTINTNHVETKNLLSSQSSKIDSGNNTLKNLINTKGVVKSVQHGYVDGIPMNAQSSGTFEIQISDINPDTSTVFIHFHGDFCINYIREHSLTKNKLLIRFDHSLNGSSQTTSGFDYQIIEFY